HRYPPPFPTRRSSDLEDVSAVIALYRPGPMAQNWHTEYAERKNKRKPVVFDHPDLEEILGPTFGLMIYQEQHGLALVLAFRILRSEEHTSELQSPDHL